MNANESAQHLGDKLTTWANSYRETVADGLRAPGRGQGDDDSGVRDGTQKKNKSVPAVNGDPLGDGGDGLAKLLAEVRAVENLARVCGDAERADTLTGLRQAAQEVLTSERRGYAINWIVSVSADPTQATSDPRPGRSVRLAQAVDDLAAELRGESKPAEATSTPKGDFGISWQEAQEHLRAKMQRGEAYAGQNALGKEIGCHPKTAKKAIDNDPDLRDWRQEGRARRKQGAKPGCVNGPLRDGRKREPPSEPSARLEEADAECLVDGLADELTDDGRERLGNWPPEARKKVGKWLAEYPAGPKRDKYRQQVITTLNDPECRPVDFSQTKEAPSHADPDRLG